MDRNNNRPQTKLVSSNGHLSRRKFVLAGGALGVGALTLRHAAYSKPLGVYGIKHALPILNNTNFSRSPDNSRVSMLNIPDGGLIRYAYWAAPERSSRGTILIANGYAEFIEKYFQTIRNFILAGFAVAAFDWRGQGGSTRYHPDSKLGIVPSFGDLLTDLEVVFRQVSIDSENGPIHILAQSMGGLVTLRALQLRLISPDTTVLSAPLLKFAQGNYTSMMLARAAICAGFGQERVPGWKLLDLKNPYGQFGMSPDAHKALASHYISRPSLCVFAPSYQWVSNVAWAATETAKEFSFKASCPILVLSAQNDVAVDNSGHHELYEANNDVSLSTIQDASHDIFQMQEEIRHEARRLCIDHFAP